MRVRIITANKIVADYDAEFITAWGSKGMFGVMDLHMNFITNLRKSVVKIKTNTDEEMSYYVHGGVGRILDQGFDIFTEFAASIAETRGSFIREEIDDLQIEIKGLEEDSLQMSILSNKIDRYESLREHLKD